MPVPQMIKINLLLAILLLLVKIAAGSEPELWFKSLSVADGLSESTVQCIIQDRKGKIWMGTRDGLNRFNGYNFKVYNYNERDKSTVSSNFINCLFEDSKGLIWVGTNSNGVCYYDYDRDQFVRITGTADSRYNLAGTSVWDILEDTSGDIWVATMDGLFRLCGEQHIITDHFISTHHPGSLSDNNVRTLALDSNGNLWLGTDDKGICKFNSRGNTFTCITTIPGDPRSLSSNHIRKIYFESDSIMWIGTTDRGINRFNINSLQNQRFSIAEDQNEGNPPNPLITGILSAGNGRIWIATENKGIKLFDPEDGSFITYDYVNYSDNSLTSNSITNLYRDRDGIIWAGANGYGVNYFFPNNHGVKRFQHIPFDANSISHNNIRTFHEDRNGNIWVGTDGGGIDVFDADLNKLYTINHQTRGAGFKSDVALMIESDSRGDIWIATWGDGLLRYSPATSSFSRFLNRQNDTLSLGANQITSLHIDQDDNVWVSCFKEGLFVLRAGSGYFSKVTFGEGLQYERAFYYITKMLKDSGGNFWVATFDGLFLQTGNVSLAFRHDMMDTTSISSDIVYTVFEDSRQRIWIGTNNKLNLYDPQQRIFHKFGDQEGFSSNVIYSIAEDSSGYLWLSTNRGIIRFHPDNQQTRKFNIHHGLQNTQFNANATLRRNNGMLLFGGISGFNQIDPYFQSSTKENPQVLLTGLYLFNQLQKPGAENSPLSRHLSATEEIRLKHSDRVLTIEFVGLNYFSPRQTEYAYRLRGFEKDWNYVGSDRQAIYTNLNHGRYVFEVMAKETDQDWDYERITSLQITILPPFWQTELAIVAYVLIVFLLILLLRLFILKKERVKMKDKFERYRIKKAQELDAMRLRFFTNISHDLRTPLTLILAPFEKLLNTETDEEKKYQINVVYKNALRMERLINQLLDLRKQETSSLKLNLSHGDIILFLNQIVESFQDLALQKNIDFGIESCQKSLYLMFDHDKLDKIMFNLLSNAFKFTLQGGKITVKVGVSDAGPEQENAQKDFRKFVRISVIDTGKGIPPELQEKVFERFFHLNDAFYSGIEGTGIGLSLSKDYVELHGGQVLLESKPGKGSEFIVCLPLRTSDHQAWEELVDDENFIIEEGCEDIPPVDNDKPLALIAEDNHELREYIKNSLSGQYSVLVCEDGEKALKLAMEHVPDIVITDIMMPVMDGVELTRRLKQNLSTSHIPVILLTARSADEQKLEGINAGADDYITKPFSFEILDARMQNILQLRDKLRERYSKLIKLEASEIEVENQDEKFIRKVLKVVEENLSDSEYSVEKLSSDLGLSRVTLYRKLNALISQTPVEFIRNTRLERAAQLLRKSGMNISEVCYDVGFMNPVYFSKCFKKKYGILPSEFIARETT